MKIAIGVLFLEELCFAFNCVSNSLNSSPNPKLVLRRLFSRAAAEQANSALRYNYAGRNMLEEIHQKIDALQTFFACNIWKRKETINRRLARG